MASELDFRLVSADEGDGAALVAAMVEEVRELYDGLDLNSPDMPAADAAELGPPGGAFLVGYRVGVAVCAGGIKRLPDLSEGYTPVPNFNGNPVATFFGEKRLSG